MLVLFRNTRSYSASRRQPSHHQHGSLLTHVPHGLSCPLACPGADIAARGQVGWPRERTRVLGHV
jgi:hypothetical protein